MANKYLAIGSGGMKEEVEGLISSAGAEDAGKIPALDAGGKISQTMMPTGVGPDTKTLTASEALAGGDFINIWNDSGTVKMRKADATTSGKPAHGFVKDAVESAASGIAYLDGMNDQLSSLTLGADYFLSTTPGGVTATPPSSTGNIVQYLGTAMSATEITTEFGEPMKRA